MILKLLMFAIGALLLSAQPPPKDNNPTAHKGSAKAQQSETKLPTPGVEEGQGGPKNRSTEESAEKVDTDRRIARYTLVLAGVAALQFLVLIYHGWTFQRSLKETKTATELTRQSIILAYPPKLIVRNVVIHDSQRLVDCGATPSDEPFRGTIEIANVGKTPAHVTLWCCEPSIRESTRILPMVNPVACLGRELMPKITLPAGTSHIHTFVGTSRVTEKDLRSINGNGITVFVIGSATYQDDLGNLRTTRFCRKWNHERKRFAEVDDPDYENSD